MKQTAGFLRSFFLFTFVFLALQPLAKATDPDPSAQNFQIFRPIQADPNATTDKWTAVGFSEPLAKVLTDYEQAPTMANAIRVLQKYKDFGKADDARRAAFQHYPKVFQTLDAAKYELILRTQQAIPGIHHSYRAGSTAARFKAWVDWAKGGFNMEDMPKLNANKQFKSDDDVVNVASKAASKANPLASELLNGETARAKFMEVTQNEFGVALDPKLMEVEFLSPTSAYKIIQHRRPGE